MRELWFDLPPFCCGFDDWDWDLLDPPPFRGRDTEECISGHICVTVFATELAKRQFCKRIRRKEKAT